MNALPMNLEDALSEIAKLRSIAEELSEGLRVSYSDNEQLRRINSSLEEQVALLEAENNGLELDIDTILLDETNAKILSQIKNNDPSLDYIVLDNFGGQLPYDREDYEYSLESPRDMELIGRYLSNNTMVESLDLTGFNDESIEALVTLLDRTPNLKALDLSMTEISDRGVEALMCGFANGGRLQELYLEGNRAITTKGLLTIINLLCDTSSVNKTFLSNHTLEKVWVDDKGGLDDLFYDIRLNKLADKRQVAMIKVMRSHNDFDMRPFFRWDFKMLPLAIGWLEEADAIQTDFEKNIAQRKLSVIYQFVRSMPEMHIEARLRANEAPEQVNVEELDVFA